MKIRKHELTMSKKNPLCIKYLLLIFTCVILVHTQYHNVYSGTTTSNSSIITVKEGESIQEAINKAPEGATIYIEPGTYIQYQIIVNKTLTIIGKNREETIINGNQEEEATALFSVIANHVTIKNLTITNARNDIGIAIILKNVQNITIENCKITENHCGIEFTNCNNSRITLNILTNNTYGIKITSGASSHIAFNNFKNNTYGISFNINAKNNIIYCNNFENTMNREGLGVSFNKWNSTYVLGGNYWNDYSENDQKGGPNQDQPGSDGIGDKAYSEEDYYPYIRKLQFFKLGLWNSKEYYLTISTNASNISNVIFNPEQKIISFTTQQDITAYCRIVIPRTLLDAAKNEWKITANQESIIPTIFQDEDFTCFYFTFSQNVNQITIEGITAIPELQPNFVALILLITTLITILIRKILKGQRKDRTIFHNP
jgi:parallel beta-helix repeat protein